MTTITLNTTTVATAVATAQRFAALRESDFAGKITIVGKDGKIEVKASNIEQSIILKEISFVSSDLTQDSFLPFSVDAKRLLTVLKAAKTDEVQIELHDELLVVKSGRSKVKVETLANTQEIEIVKSGKNFDIKNQLGAMEQVLHAVDNNNQRYELNGVLLQSKGGIFNIVGTDTKRLAVVTTDTDSNDFEVVIPRKGIEAILKLFKGFDVMAEIDEQSLTIHTEALSYSVRLINGKYPEWQRIVPQTFTQTIVFPTEGLKTIVQEASIFEKEIVVEISNNKIRVTDFNNDTEVIDSYATDNINMRFGINSQSLIDFLDSCNEDKIQICFNEGNMPIMLVANPNYKEIVMPLIAPEVETAKEENNDDKTNLDAA